MLRKLIACLNFMLFFGGSGMVAAHADEAAKHSGFRVISGVAMSKNGMQINIGIEIVLLDLEVRPKALLDHFPTGDVIGYVEENGKFWIIVSATPPLSHSSAYTLYTHRLFFEKGQLKISDLTTTELKQLSTSKIDLKKALSMSKIPPSPAKP